ncbi:proline dehydrogenase family protein [Rhodococcus opacus]|uniref:proline dehydrogenase family protein n=1 Tax=Rhodococcus opacus TaxID=37919 RepID=UPI000EA8B652|nr:proline dehydrogenase family protein [Rhodococcus opacus]QZS55161.1 proline dehydrogenase family protein [Rhodococcus opacus]RKM71772.1 proline dehydrogenase [Rhodococcus opacus]
MKAPTVLANPLRPAILAAARSSRVKRAVTGAPVTRKLVDRFVAGENRGSALATVREILDSGRSVSIDFLGEDTRDAAGAQATVDEYLALVADLGALPEAAEGTSGVRRLEVSMKLSALGLALAGDGRRIATDNARTICAAADAAGVWVTVDAEDHTTTDSTLAIVRELRNDYPWLGAVVQSYLRRTEDDCRALAGPGSRVRLCKGAYREPESVAFQDRAAVDASYLRCLGILMDGSGYPMVASHDPAVIDAVAPLVGRTGRAADAYEHQMLFGIRDVEQRRLANEDKQVRVYVPYGSQWYAYFMRRLAERPSNLRFFLRSVVTRD